MATVFIGVDPHKLSVTIEVVDDRETLLATGRFAETRPATPRWADASRLGRNGSGR